MSGDVQIGIQAEKQQDHEKKLIPTEVSWADLTSLVKQVLATDHLYQKIDTRFIYGELRLSRLNKIYRFTRSSFLHGYMSQWNRYGDFFQDNLAWLAAATVYIALVLTAMQVGLATDALAENKAFQSASYEFAALSILGPLIAISLIIFTFCYMFINNWISTLAYQKKIFNAIQPAQRV
ncbi:uncharacterized protein N7483_004672 [Penicillium malachiteum]|uniref:uncharacterized protein n=1 Tax=Penicillium malachiteum TaxID=1324776 RepID=UPI0025481647|nr:uncharacterized protein N7483_004672 [Penicillium malachiteum]KAJ5730164.1 hypothetical protein N7483_004672 [Penicillium malachiteum]